jgi:hypothetical protein
MGDLALATVEVGPVMKRLIEGGIFTAGGSGPYTHPRAADWRSREAGSTDPGRRPFKPLTSWLCLNWLALLGAPHALPKLHGRKRGDQALLRSMRCGTADTVRELRVCERVFCRVLRRLR